LTVTKPTNQAEEPFLVGFISIKYMPFSMESRKKTYEREAF
jgi:hypothetical protein